MKRKRPETPLINEFLSPMEMLAPELLWKIFEFVPEAVFELRLTSKLLRSRIDEYVACPIKIPIVQRLIVMGREPEGINVWLNIPKNKAPLFELLLQQKCAPAGLISRLKRFFHVLPEHPNHYYLEFETVPDESAAYLGSCMGTRIEETSISHYDEQMTNSSLPILLKGIQLDELKIFINLLSDVAVNEISNIAPCPSLSPSLSSPIPRLATTCEQLIGNIKENRVERLSVTVREVTCGDPAKLLLDLSSLVSSLHIEQLYDRACCGGDNSRYFMGSKRIDWASVFIEMFSRKLDKLSVKNAYSEYLSTRGAEMLTQRLPLLEKKLWFQTSCSNEDAFEYKSNDYAVKATWSRIPSKRILSIKHSSREYEEFES